MHMYQKFYRAQIAEEVIPKNMYGFLKAMVKKKVYKKFINK